MNFYNNQGYNYPYIPQTTPNYYYQNAANNYNSPPKPNYIPMMLVAGLEGTNEIIVFPNQSVYLKDSNSNMLFIKQADAQGRYSLKAYDLKEVSLNDIGKPIDNGVTRDDFKELTNHVSILTQKIDSILKSKEVQDEQHV